VGAEEVLAFLRCPACGGKLEPLGREGGREFPLGPFRCLSCAHTFPLRHGLPDFRLRECFAPSNRLFRALYDLYAPLYDRLENALAKLMWPDFSEVELREEIAACLERLRPE